MRKELLLANLREIPDFPIPGILFYDVTTLFKNADCVQEMINAYTMHTICINAPPKSKIGANTIKSVTGSKIINP